MDVFAAALEKDAEAVWEMGRGCGGEVILRGLGEDIAAAGKLYLQGRYRQPRHHGSRGCLRESG